MTNAPSFTTTDSRVSIVCPLGGFPPLRPRLMARTLAVTFVFLALVITTSSYSLRARTLQGGGEPGFRTVAAFGLPSCAFLMRTSSDYELSIVISVVFEAFPAPHFVSSPYSSSSFAADASCETPAVSVCGYRLNTRVYRSVQLTAGGPGAGTLGSVMCGYFSQQFSKDGVCWDGYVQGANNVFSCAGSCSPTPCQADGMAFVPCNEIGERLAGFTSSSPLPS